MNHQSFTVVKWVKNPHFHIEEQKENVKQEFVVLSTISTVSWQQQKGIDKIIVGKPTFDGSVMVQKSGAFLMSHPVCYMLNQ